MLWPVAVLCIVHVISVKLIKFFIVTLHYDFAKQTVNYNSLHSDFSQMSWQSFSFLVVTFFVFLLWYSLSALPALLFYVRNLWSSQFDRVSLNFRTATLFFFLCFAFCELLLHPAYAMLLSCSPLVAVIKAI